MYSNHKNIIKENRIRLDMFHAYYNPLTGEGSPIERFKLVISNDTVWYLPMIMAKIPAVEFVLNYKSVESCFKTIDEKNYESLLADFIIDLSKDRLVYDFEFWCYTCVMIQDKETKKDIPYKLNRAQRKYLKALESMRVRGVPIRVVLLKARQWGGSTLTQIYMAWLQLIHKENWHSTIVCDIENQSKNIRSMYSRMLKNYPDDVGQYTLKPFEGSDKNKIIEERGNIISIGSMQKPDSLRSNDIAMCHCSEVGFWKKTEGKSPEDLIQTLRAAISNVPDSLFVLESTAKGVGNFFHKEWLASKDGKSSYMPVFISWFEIELYQKEINNYSKFIQSMTEYDWFLWKEGATLEGINWYKSFKQAENYDDWRMQSEYPSNDIEAFQSTGKRVFKPAYVQKARKNIYPPEMEGDLFSRSLKGEHAFESLSFGRVPNGDMKIWALPDKILNVKNRYCVSVDVGGKSEGADFSVIRVFDRICTIDGGEVEVVATWRGHMDPDLVAWKAAQIAYYYNKAMLVIESNYYEKDANTEGDHFLTVLDEIAPHYDNLYARTNPEQIREGIPNKYGFHMNIKTKPLVIDFLNSALRDDLYIEHDVIACDEFDTYEIKENGRMGAVDKCHDDMVMSTAIGIYVAYNEMPKAVIINKDKPTPQRIKNRVRSMAEF